MIEATSAGIRLRLRVQPRAARTELAGRHGDALKIRVAAPPVDGEANVELIRFLARVLNVPRTSVSIAAGSGGRSKMVAVEGIAADEAARRLGL
jgi:uncharacterized protein (TIGR00251 family)